MLLQPVQGHRGLVGQDVHALCEFVCHCNKENKSYGKWGAVLGERQCWEGAPVHSTGQTELVLVTSLSKM